MQFVNKRKFYRAFANNLELIVNKIYVFDEKSAVNLNAERFAYKVISIDESYIYVEIANSAHGMSHIARHPTNSFIYINLNEISDEVYNKKYCYTGRL